MNQTVCLYRWTLIIFSVSLDLSQILNPTWNKIMWSLGTTKLWKWLESFSGRVKSCFKACGGFRIASGDLRRALPEHSEDPPEATRTQLHLPPKAVGWAKSSSTGSQRIQVEPNPWIQYSLISWFNLHFLIIGHFSQWFCQTKWFSQRNPHPEA